MTHASTNWKFHAISGPRAYEEVVDQLTFSIRAGGFRPGDRLPNIDDLASAMHVSAPTIGEAIKVLSKAKVLVAQRGINGGLHVLSDRIPNAVMGLSSGWRDASAIELVEARRPIEMQLAHFASTRGTPADFEVMKYSIRKLEESSDKDLSRRIHYDHLFHYAMARAARSEVLAYYQHQILEQLFLRMRPYFEVYEDVNHVIAMHHKTLNALRTQNSDLIEAVVDEHLKPLEEQVIGHKARRPHPRRGAHKLPTGRHSNAKTGGVE
jgi:GntR family transcriptional regulator, transcriptional repressor for pyruvate dehydrogenase complex